MRGAHIQVMSSKVPVEVRVIDLFSGVGALTHGFVREGFRVVAGMDTDESCRYAFETNNRSTFILRDVSEITPDELNGLYGNKAVRILIGCAPCQPFSTLNSKRALNKARDEKWSLLDSFLRLTKGVLPEIVSMENVPQLANQLKFPIFGRFVKTLKKIGYHVSYCVVDASEYGVPQRRRRLVLLASRLGPISLLPPTRRRPATVRDAIGGLSVIRDGQTSKSDPLHRASRLSGTNRKRIAATPRDGGSAKHWNQRLLPKCFRKKRGRSYKASVYGRMRWNEPGPTVTTHCITLGTGRFGHPTQRRAMSLREAARLQTFPDAYVFQAPGKIKVTNMARHIGNAVPVRLARVIARSIRKHIAAQAIPTRTRKFL
jgi:DNA (cytosine-5)-methyltransferase 1